ncbi:MAG: ATP-binding protein [Alphaproteobacteria bacterium]|nr:ATP-binding protein [Alphaproteobacteria bacterium]
MRLLVVEDNPVDRQAHIRLLTQGAEGRYSISEAETAADALCALDADSFDALLVDYRLPDATGVEFIQLLRDRGIDADGTAFVMITGPGDDATAAAEAVGNGFHDFLIKGRVSGPALKRLVDNAVEKARLSQSVQDHQRALEQSHQDMADFARVVSHDLKSPLNTMIGYLELLQVGYGDRLEGPAAGYVKDCIAAGRRMSRMIDDLLRFSHETQSADAFAETDLNQVTEDAISNLAAAIEERKAAVSVGPMPHVHGQPSVLLQLFQNLIGNAIKYTDPSVTPQVDISAQAEGANWHIILRDNGVGIAEGDRERVFRMSERIARDDEGSGIGLAVSRRIVDRHGGRIWIEGRRDGQGSEFHILLPQFEAAELAELQT